MNKSRATLFGCFLLALLFFSCSSPEPESKAEESQKENKFEEVEKKLEELEEQSDEEWTFDTAPSDLTLRDPSELSSFDIPPNVDELPKTKPETTDDLPLRFDWRDTQGVVGRVQDQGECGSCWAFGACSIAESVYAINGTSFVDISEQWLIDCNTEGWGCVGGLIALSYFVDQADSCGEVGAVTETAAPYTHRDGDCYCGTERMTPLPAWGVISTENHPASVETIKRAIKENGPIIAVIDIDLPFLAYQGGIYNWNSLFRFPQSHLVVLTGWDDTQGINGIWFLRNSFGPMWGEAGTMRIEYGTAGVARFAASFTKQQNSVRGSVAGGADSSDTESVEGEQGLGGVGGFDEDLGNSGGDAAPGGEISGDSSGESISTSDVEAVSGEEDASGQNNSRVNDNHINNQPMDGGGLDIFGSDEKAEGGASDKTVDGSSRNQLINELTALDRRIAYLDRALDGQATGLIPATPNGPTIDLNDLKIDLSKIDTNNPELFGVWLQLKGNNQSDVAPGGYIKSFLLISPSGLLEFIRSYDDKNTIKTITRLDWQLDGDKIVIGSDKVLREGRLMKNINIPLGEKIYCITAPSKKLPITTDWFIDVVNKKTLVVGNKTYVKVEKQNSY